MKSWMEKSFSDRWQAYHTWCGLPSGLLKMKVSWEAKPRHELSLRLASPDSHHYTIIFQYLSLPSTKERINLLVSLQLHDTCEFSSLILSLFLFWPPASSPIRFLLGGIITRFQKNSWIILIIIILSNSVFFFFLPCTNYSTSSKAPCYTLHRGTQTVIRGNKGLTEHISIIIKQICNLRFRKCGTGFLNFPYNSMQNRCWACFQLTSIVKLYFLYICA